MEIALKVWDEGASLRGHVGPVAGREFREVCEIDGRGDQEGHHEEDAG